MVVVVLTLMVVVLELVNKVVLELVARVVVVLELVALVVVVLELVTNVMPEPLKTTVAPLCKPVPVIVTACAEAPCARGKPL